MAPEPVVRWLQLRFAVLAGLVALLQFRIVILMFGPQYRLSVDVARGVLAGEPHWRVYQSRLLGPYLVRGLEPLFDSFLAAHVFASVALLGVTGYLVLRWLTRLHADAMRAVALYLLFAFLVVCCFHKPWLYVWDTLDLLLFVVFNYFVAREKDVRFFAALFVVAIFNRESALYIAAWMILDPLVKLVVDRVRGVRGRFDFRMPVAGGVLLAGGLALVEWLRSRLLVREVGPELIGQGQGVGPRFHYMLGDNLVRLGEALTSIRFTFSFLIPLLLLAYLVFALAVARRDPRGRLALSLVHVLLLGTTLVFGVVFETRVYLALLPFIAFNLIPPPRPAGAG